MFWQKLIIVAHYLCIWIWIITIFDPKKDPKIDAFLIARISSDPRILFVQIFFLLLLLLLQPILKKSSIWCFNLGLYPTPQVFIKFELCVIHSLIGCWGSNSLCSLTGDKPSNLGVFSHSWRAFLNPLKLPFVHLASSFLTLQIAHSACPFDCGL